jgi:hypothetical protein
MIVVTLWPPLFRGKNLRCRWTERRLSCRVSLDVESAIHFGIFAENRTFSSSHSQLLHWLRHPRIAHCMAVLLMQFSNIPKLSGCLAGTAADPVTRVWGRGYIFCQLLLVWIWSYYYVFIKSKNSSVVNGWWNTLFKPLSGWTVWQHAGGRGSKHGRSLVTRFAVRGWFVMSSVELWLILNTRADAIA